MKSKMTMLAVALFCAAIARAATWTSADGLATIEAPTITEGVGTLEISGSPITATVAAGDAVVVPAVTVVGTPNFTASVADGASLTFLSISSSDGGKLNLLTKNGGGTLVLAGGMLKSKNMTYTAGGLTLSNGASLLLDSILRVDNTSPHAVSLLSGAVLRCQFAWANNPANGENASFHADGGIFQQTSSGSGGHYNFENIATTTIGAGGLIVDTSYATDSELRLYGTLTTAPGVAVDGGLRIRGTERLSSLQFFNSYVPNLSRGIIVEAGGVAAFQDNKNGSVALSGSSVTVRNGGELRVTAQMSRLSVVKDLTFGETNDDKTYLRFSGSSSSPDLFVTNSLSVNGVVYVRFLPDTFTAGTRPVLRAPKGSFDAAAVAAFALDPIHDGSAAVFSVDDSNADYDKLVATVTSSVVKIDPATSGNSTLTLKNKTLRPIASGIVSNPIVGEADDGFVLDTPCDVEFTNTFQNAGYFIKTGAGKATLSYDGGIKISGKAGTRNTYRKSEFPLVFPATGEMPTVDGTSIVENRNNIMDFNVLAGTLALAPSGAITHADDMLVGGNKLFLDGNGEPIPATLELDDGTLNMARIFVGDVHAYRGESACLEKRPHNTLVVRGGTMSASGAFVLGNFNDSYYNGIAEYIQYGGDVSTSAQYFHIGYKRTSTSATLPDAGQALARFAVYGGTFSKVATISEFPARVVMRK